MNRRTILARLGAVGAGSVLAGCGGDEVTSPSNETTAGETTTDRATTDRTATDQTTESGAPNWVSAIADEWGFDRIVDLESQGADSTGGRTIDDVIHDTMDDGTLVYLPPGRYQIEDSIASESIPLLGIVGDDATIVPPDGFSSTLIGLGWSEPGGELLFSNIDFDFSAEKTGGRPVLARAADRVVLRDVTVNGVSDVDKDLVRIDVTSEDGTGLVERLSLPDGGIPKYRTTGCQVGDDNRGDVAFVDCHIAGFPDNGLYADPPVGAVTVRGGTYLNNGVAGVRVESQAKSIVQGVHVRCDTDHGGENMRGIRLRAGDDITVENCTVELQNVTSSDGAIVFAPELGAGTVRNCRVKVDADNVNAIRIKSPNEDTPDETGPFRFENIVITGNASNGPAVDAANRDDCIFRDLCIHQTGEDRDGFLLDDVEGELVDSFVSVTGRPFAFRNSSVTRRNVSVDRSPKTTDLSSVDSCQ